MPNDVSTDLNPPPPEVRFDFPDGLGLCRSTGELIALLLMGDSINDRASILAWVAVGMNIPIDDVVREYNSRDR